MKRARRKSYDLWWDRSGTHCFITFGRGQLRVNPIPVPRSGVNNSKREERDAFITLLAETFDVEYEKILYEYSSLDIKLFIIKFIRQLIRTINYDNSIIAKHIRILSLTNI